MIIFVIQTFHLRIKHFISKISTMNVAIELNRLQSLAMRDKILFWTKLLFLFYQENCISIFNNTIYGMTRNHFLVFHIHIALSSGKVSNWNFQWWSNRISIDWHFDPNKTWSIMINSDKEYFKEKIKCFS